MMCIIARLYIFTIEEGGIQDPWFSGIMPSFNINEQLIMCKVESMENQSFMQAGKHHDVCIEIPDGHLIQEFIKPSKEFLLNFGAKIVAKGVIVDV